MKLFGMFKYKCENGIKSLNDAINFIYPIISQIINKYFKLIYNRKKLN